MHDIVAGSAHTVDGRGRWRFTRRATPWSRWLVRWALAVPMAFHGLWNIGAAGTLWWTESSGLPPDLRWVVGLGEVLAALSLASGVLCRVAAIALVPLMVGAVFQHMGSYSFKEAGFETPLVYAMLAMAVALEPSTIALTRAAGPASEPRPATTSTGNDGSAAEM